ncbi:hypothetical protein [Halomonas sp. IOP_31]|uniref:hypothetical protein n=1 Tax=Halomonas sp. IOP_31 TaxID=2876584 RepID=UPI001E2B8C30|nr:hypothetical protein [Halomonas sp. IOP_31]MCD6006869.1 hypothetical protein [Halomonas sp. IOP_31]
MQPYREGLPIGDVEAVTTDVMGQTADRMFNAGADEVRVTKLRGAGYTRKMPGKKKKKKKRKRK